MLAAGIEAMSTAVEAFSLAKLGGETIKYLISFAFRWLCRWICMDLVCYLYMIFRVVPIVQPKVPIQPAWFGAPEVQIRKIFTMLRYEMVKYGFVLTDITNHLSFIPREVKLRAMTEKSFYLGSSWAVG